ncbi:MAG: ATP-binding protein [Methanomicrobiales archaeon]|nr:ATP-binding protein [Methanomicrobiales archaeon]
MVSIEELERFNPWWTKGGVPLEWTQEYRRKLYFAIEPYVKRRQILLVYGLRRVGKTTLMMQVISSLLKFTNPRHILYFSFDEEMFTIKDVLESYQKVILHRNFEDSPGPLYLFFDEIQKRDGWENTVKTYYDLYPDTRFFLSGSASAGLRKRSTESLAGRILNFTLPPLLFEEFLELNGKNTGKIKEDPDLWKREIIPLFYRYLKFGQFPELARETDETFAKKYLLNTIIERVIYRDLPEEFGIKDIELLRNIIILIGKNPGMIVKYSEISKNFGRDQRTVANYFEYLEYGLLLRFVYNYRGGALASMRKSKKVYFSSPNFVFALNQNLDRVLPLMLENLVACQTGAKFFYRDGFEVDFVAETEDGLVAIEVKNKQNEVSQLLKFREKFTDKTIDSYLLDVEGEGEKDGVRIIPVWKFLLGI